MLAEDAGASVGVCVRYRTFPSFAGRPAMWIEDIFVAPSHRRRGLARAAFAQLARLAVEQGCVAVEWSVPDWNEPALAAYRAMGAVPRDGWTHMRVSGDALRALADRKEAA